VEVQRYDFRRPHRISKERLRTIEAMYERMIKNMESYLMSRVRGQVEVRLQSVEQFSFGEFTLSLPTPCCSYVMDINGANGLQGVIDFGTDFAFFLVDRLFGGGSAPTVMSRPLTSLEQDAVRIVAERTATIVRDVWSEVMPLELVVTGFEAAPEILQVCAREDPVLVANHLRRSRTISQPPTRAASPARRAAMKNCWLSAGRRRHRCAGPRYRWPHDSPSSGSA
jgi:flagellar motor switch protein FliM